MQTVFMIRKEREGELFEYIKKNCHGKILHAYSKSEDFHFDSNDEISEPEYLITLDSFDISLNYKRDYCEEIGKDVFYIHPYDNENNSVPFPFIQYQRFPNDELHDTCFPCRIYIGSYFIPADYKGELKKLFSKIKDWIKRSAVRKEMDGLFRYYIIE